MSKKFDVSLTFLGSDSKRIEAILIQHGFTDQAETLSVQAELQGVDMSECKGECEECNCEPFIFSDGAKNAIESLNSQALLDRKFAMDLRERFGDTDRKN
jgi:hypothetical protein